MCFARSLTSYAAQIHMKIQVHHVSKKTVQNCFCQNFVKFPPILIIFGRRMAKRLKLCEMHSFFTSPNSCHHTTVLNTDVPKILHSFFETRCRRKTYVNVRTLLDTETDTVAYHSNGGLDERNMSLYTLVVAILERRPDKSVTIPNTRK